MDNTSTLEERCAILEHENARLLAQNVELTAKLNWLTESLSLSQKKLFGVSSEKTQPQEQPPLFNEAESECKPEKPEPTFETVTYKRRKEKLKREVMLEELPVEVVEHTLPPEERVCPNCGEEMHEMSVEVRQELKFVPAKVIVVQHRRHVYSCRKCDREGTSTPVVTAPGPKPVIPGSLASPSAVAYIMNSKYVDGLPLYRQEQQLGRLGIELSRQTMANWVVKSSESWLSPVYARMREHLLKRDILHADETVVQVLREEGRSAESKSQMWLYRTGRDSPAIVLYEYQTGRHADYPKKFLKDFKGYLQVDGYQAYRTLPSDITLAGLLGPRQA